MTNINVINAVKNINNKSFDLSTRMIELEVIQGAISQLMERIDEMEVKGFFDRNTAAGMCMVEMQDTVRLIDMAFYPMFENMKKEVDQLESASSILFDIFIKRDETK